VISNIHLLCSSFPLILQGPAASIPQKSNGENSLTLEDGRFGIIGRLYGRALYRTQARHFEIDFRTTSKPLGIQNLSRIFVNVALGPPCKIF
jgi:hypothetical protein